MAGVVGCDPAVGQFPERRVGRERFERGDIEDGRGEPSRLQRIG